MADISKQPMVRLCSYCQKEQGIEKEMRDAVKAGVRFTHGVCIRHFEEQMRQGGFNDEIIRSTIAKLSSNNDGPPDLKENPELVKLYKQGFWTPEQIRQAQNSQQKISESYSFDPKKLKNIKMCYMCEKEFGLDQKRMSPEMSHGLCLRHIKYWLEKFPKIRGTDKESAIKKIKDQSTAPAIDIREHPELIRMFAGPYTSFDSTFSKK